MTNDKADMVASRREVRFVQGHPLWWQAFALVIIAIVALPASAATGRFIAPNTPNFVSTAKSLGPANPAEIIEVSIWLNLHNRDLMDSLAEELYNPTSPNYRHWLQGGYIAAEFAPRAREARTVEQFFSRNKMRVVTVGPYNFFVRAQGTLGAVEKAFHVQIETFELNGKIYRANTTEPYMEDPAAALTHAVFGLDNLEYQHPLRARGAPKHPSPGIAERNSDSDHGFFTSNCFTGVKTETYSTSTSYPIATYEGNVYTNNIFGCGYTPQEIQTAYDLTELYSEGFDGTGQTIAIIDWCGSPTIRADANAFSKRFGLPPLTPSNFHILNSSTPAKCAAPDVEINIDVEWAHAIAPGAHIALVIAPSSSLNDVDTAELYAIANGLGNVISGSYGSEELLTSPAALDEANLINETAALLGISANFASGDNGDFTADNPANSSSVFAPADSPYATAVGGISLALNSDNTVAWQTGWGTNVNTLVSNGSISDPPTEGFFYQGSGGGPSAVFSKPSFQNNLHGKQRLLPDISWLADPYTGGVIAISEPAVYPPVEWQVWGGTSLATPMFSALWAIANQVAGLPLGQAARYLYSMPADTITDVVPVGSANNVSATIQESPSLIDTYSAAQLAAPLESTTTLYSALLNPPLYPGDIFVLTFGTDTGLETTVGWDDVTGLGTPNGKAFADFFKP